MGYDKARGFYQRAARFAQILQAEKKTLVNDVTAVWRGKFAGKMFVIKSRILNEWSFD